MMSLHLARKVGEFSERETRHILISNKKILLFDVKVLEYFFLSCKIKRKALVSLKNS